MDLIQYIGISDSIIVPIFNYLLDLLQSEDSCKEREFGAEQVAESEKHFLIKSVVFFS